MTLDQTLDQIKKTHGAKVARAFEAAIADIKSSVVLRRVIDALENGNIDGAIAALNIDESAFAPLRAAITAAYGDGGAAVVALTRFSAPLATKAVVRWDVTNPVAERYLREELGTKITRVTQDTIQAARDAMVSGYSKGHGPRQIALDVVGRVGANGKRSGGVLGLNGPQEQYVRNMRAYLEIGDYNAVMRMSKRDKRFDKTILKAMRDEKPLSKAQIDKLTQRYSDRLLKLRGDTIARTETANAVEQSRVDGFRVGIDKEGIPPRYVNKEWLHGGGGMRPREQHVYESGQKVEGLDTPFIMQDMTPMQRPHDPAGPAKHVINCFPPDAMISTVGLNGGVRHEYIGDLVKVSCGGMVNLTVTPNHPILTQRGWVAAELVNSGDYVFCACGEVNSVPKLDVNNIVSSAEELYNSMKPLCSVSGSVGAVVDFHGHVTDKDIDIVSHDSGLMSGVMPTCSKVFGEFSLESADVVTSGLFVPAKLGLSFLIASHHANGGVCGLSGPLSILWGSLCSGAVGPLADVGLLYSEIIKCCIDYRSASANLLSDSVSRVTFIEKAANAIVVNLSIDKSLSKHPDGAYGDAFFSPEVVTHVSRSHYEGFVYNFQSENSILVSNGVVNHNCTCTVLMSIDWPRMRSDGVV